MGELQFPPYSDELGRHPLLADRVLPLALLAHKLWSYEYRENRDRDLEHIARRTHLLVAPDGRVHEFTLLDEDLGVDSLPQAMHVLDGFTEAANSHAIAWDEGARRHVLLDSQLDSMREPETVDALRSFLRHLLQRPGTRPTTLMAPTADPIGELTQAMRILARAADHVRDVSRAIEDAYHLDVTSSALDAALEGPDNTDFLDSELREAVSLIDADAPVSPTGVKGYRWEPPLTLNKLFLYVDAAASTDPGYREAVQRNEAFAAERQQKIDVARSQTCTACGRRPVYLPIDDAAMDCYSHIAGDELKRVERVWDDAMDTLSCPGCNAPAGTMCTEDQDQLVLVNGRWPRIRRFRGRSAHKERLDLSYQTTPTT